MGLEKSWRPAGRAGPDGAVGGAGSLAEGRQPADAVPEGGGLPLGLCQHQDLLLGQAGGQGRVLLARQVVGPAEGFGLSEGLLLAGVQHGLLPLQLGDGEACLLVQPHLLPLPGEGPEPALLLLGLLGAQQVALPGGAAAQPEGVPDAHMELLVLPVLQVHHLQAVHVHPALVIQHVPAEEVLLTVDELVVKEKKHPLLAPGLRLGDTSQLPGVDEF